jgi:hypothetical protein
MVYISEDDNSDSGESEAEFVLDELAEISIGTGNEAIPPVAQIEMTGSVDSSVGSEPEVPYDPVINNPIRIRLKQMQDLNRKNRENNWNSCKDMQKLHESRKQLFDKELDFLMRRHPLFLVPEVVDEMINMKMLKMFENLISILSVSSRPRPSLREIRENQIQGHTRSLIPRRLSPNSTNQDPDNFLKPQLKKFFRHSFVQNVVNPQTMLFIPLFKKYIKIDQYFSFPDENSSRNFKISLFEKFFTDVKFNIEKNIDAIIFVTPFNSGSLVDKKINIKYVPSLILSNLIDYGIPLIHELECFSNQDWGNIRKTFPNYLLLYRRYSKQTSKEKNKSCRCKTCEERKKVVLFSQSDCLRDDIKLIDEFLVILANKKTSQFLRLGNTLLSESYSFLDQKEDFEWKNKKELILDMVFRWKNEKEVSVKRENPNSGMTSLKRRRISESDSGSVAVSTLSLISNSGSGLPVIPLSTL